MPLFDLPKAVANYDALIVPGGFGVAKSLSDWAHASGSSKTVVNPDLKLSMLEFAKQGKPIGLCCISPVLAALVFKGCKITVGKAEPEGSWPYGGTVAAVEALGAKHVPCEVDQVAIDNENKIVTTPAFMCATSKDQVFYGVQAMVKQVGWLM